MSIELTGFTSHTIDVDGVGVHGVVGGSGPTVVLLHGFPQSWHEWRAIMPRLAEHHTVVAVDLRGVGGSDAPHDGYDAETLAGDVHGLVSGLDLGPAHVVGHDVGGWVAYAYARRYAADTLTLTVIETPIPGTDAFADLDVDVPMWHAEFHMVPDLPETLVDGHQADYFRYFFDVGTRGDGVITDADVAQYAAAYDGRARLRAAFEMYRAVPQNISFNASHRDAIDVPLRLIGGEHVFGPVLADTVDELRDDLGWCDVSVVILEDGQHYVVEERPDQIAALIEGHVRAR
jgi:pimeloyl-ACP methyl ester carboxylesterase